MIDSLTASDVEALAKGAPLCNLLDAIYELIKFVERNATEEAITRSGVDVYIDKAFMSLRILCVAAVDRMENGDPNCVECIKKSTPDWVLDRITELVKEWKARQQPSTSAVLQ